MSLRVELEDPDKMGYWRWIWMYWLARLRLSDRAVCVMSSNKGNADFHDYPDSIEGRPDHFVTMRCKRCGKEFTI
jgi:hypothetical protein